MDVWMQVYIKNTTNSKAGADKSTEMKSNIPCTNLWSTTDCIDSRRTLDFALAPASPCTHTINMSMHTRRYHLKCHQWPSSAHNLCLPPIFLKHGPTATRYLPKEVDHFSGKHPVDQWELLQEKENNIFKSPPPCFRSSCSYDTPRQGPWKHVPKTGLQAFSNHLPRLRETHQQPSPERLFFSDQRCKGWHPCCSLLKGPLRSPLSALWKQDPIPFWTEHILCGFFIRTSRTFRKIKKFILQSCPRQT